jgi:hypothetical protein
MIAAYTEVINARSNWRKWTCGPALNLSGDAMTLVADIGGNFQCGFLSRL